MFHIIATGLLGLLAGILVNYLSDVLPIYRKITHPFCRNCGKPQKYMHYFLWPRQCPHCETKRGLRSWIVEASFTAIFIWLYTTPTATLFYPFWISAVIWIFFGVVAVIDIELKLILYPVSIAGAILGFAAGAFLHGPLFALLGGIAGYGIMFFFYWLGTLFTRLTRRLQGDEEEVALGFGDVNLAGVLGLFVGWPNIILNLILSILLAGIVSFFIVGITLLFKRYRAFMAIPYGPFLLAGSILLLFFSAQARDLIEAIGYMFLVSPR